MTDPRTDAPAPDVVEQQQTATGTEIPAAVPDVPLDAPEADALEQAQEAGPGEHRVDRDVPLEATEADAAEQAVVVDQDEDEYR